MSGFDGKLHLVILAGGQGLRVGGIIPKQFRKTARGPLFSVALRSFLELPEQVARMGSVVVTVAADWHDLVRESVYPEEGRLRLARPGETRTASTWNALQVLADLEPAADDLVAVHDAARPFASVELLERLVVAAAASGGAVPAVPVADTVVQRDGQGRAVYLDREQLAGVQTPQVFRWELLHQAHAWASEQGVDFTDDGGLLAARGHDPQLVPGEPGNWKVTTTADWERARDILS
jgi:2-C-methyl-D-erythritol 4-phosphate cytidylyltransferase/2-C-methyl-D-erythritol 2,4-cyclodiphosphate synthase